jgi:hypothetical protein
VRKDVSSAWKVLDGGTAPAFAVAAGSVLSVVAVDCIVSAAVYC